MVWLTFNLNFIFSLNKSVTLPFTVPSFKAVFYLCSNLWQNTVTIVLNHVLNIFLYIVEFEIKVMD